MNHPLRNSGDGVSPPLTPSSSTSLNELQYPIPSLDRSLGSERLGFESEKRDSTVMTTVIVVMVTHKTRPERKKGTGDSGDLG